MSGRKSRYKVAIICFRSESKANGKIFNNSDNEVRAINLSTYYVPSIILKVLRFISLNTHNNLLHTIVLPILQMRKLKQREVK